MRNRINDMFSNLKLAVAVGAAAILFPTSAASAQSSGDPLADCFIGCYNSYQIHGDSYLYSICNTYCVNTYDGEGGGDPYIPGCVGPACNGNQP